MAKIKVLPLGLLLFMFFLNTNPACAANHTVVQGDTLWQIAQKYNSSVEQIKAINNLKNDNLAIGQIIRVDDTSLSSNTPAVAAAKTISSANYTPRGSYLVEAGDTLGGISQKLGLSVDAIRSLNNIQGDMIFAGQTLILSSSSVSRSYVERPPIVQAQAANSSVKNGQLVDWFKEGSKLLKPGQQFTAIDTQTGKSMRLVVLGGSNHCDIEPLTKADTDTMLALFTKWTWTPRPVCIQVNGQAIAASLSGMPHTTIENITDNGVTGHFDMYLYNSGPHGSGISASYVQQHRDAVLIAAN